MNLIKNITNNYPTSKKAALYYKTEPFCSRNISYSHTNNWEIYKSVEILNKHGYSVDLIDRNNSSWQPSEKFDIFLGLGVGNTGKNFVRHAEASKAKISVLMSLGPQPDISNQLTLKRYEMFFERTGVKAPPMRTVFDVVGDKFKEIINKADYIFNIGEANNNSYKSYSKYNKPILNFFPSVSPDVSYSDSWIKTRERNSFLCFAGNGFICKGVDLVLEAFLKDKSKNLHICGPSNETSFFKYYARKIEDSPNIKYHGFVNPGGGVFNDIASKCSYVVFHSAAEGCCTSVATAMKAGLVPIINPWTGINTRDLTLSEDGDLIEEIQSKTNEAKNLDDERYLNLVSKTLDKSFSFSQNSFTDSYSKALLKVINENNI